MHLLLQDLANDKINITLIIIIVYLLLFLYLTLYQNNCYQSTVVGFGGCHEGARLASYGSEWFNPIIIVVVVVVVVVVVIIIIIINMKGLAIWPVLSPQLQQLSPAFLWSPNCSLSLWTVAV
jgi:hypothetical protein